MYVQVACNQCGKEFQVPEGTAGRPVPCPWCQAVVPALPVAGPLPPTVFSLDDPALPPSTAPAERMPTSFPYFTAVAVLVVMAAVFGLTIMTLGYHSGRIPESSWRWYTAPDRSFTVQLPGDPTAEPLNPIPNLKGLGGEAFVVPRGWYSGVIAWVGWRDTEPGFARDAIADKDGVLVQTAFNAELEYRKQQSGMTNEVKRWTLRYGEYQGVQVEWDTPRGRLVERVLLVPVVPLPSALGRPRARVYFMGIEANNLLAEGPAAQRMFNSFRVGE